MQSTCSRLVWADGRKLVESSSNHFTCDISAKLLSTLLAFRCTILNDIKNLFDMHNPPTIPDLGIKYLGRSYVNFDEQVFQENLLNCE